MITRGNIKNLLYTNEIIVQSYVYKSKNGRYWIILKELEIMLTNGEVINIPKRFKYDMATIPPFLWSFIRPYDDALVAYLIHDYLYIKKNTHSMNRASVDLEMLKWANVTNNKKLSNYIRYFFVRLFGWLWWYRFL